MVELVTFDQLYSNGCNGSKKFKVVFLEVLNVTETKDSELYLLEVLNVTETKNSELP